MQIILSFLVSLMFSSSLFAIDELDLSGPTIDQIDQDNNILSQSNILENSEAKILNRSSSNDGCTIFGSVNGNRFFETENDSRNFCDSFHQFFNTRNQCNYYRANNRFQANYRYDRFFNRRGNDWRTARHGAYNDFFNFAENLRFDRRDFRMEFHFPNPCE